jgi:hypothetical protein
MVAYSPLITPDKSIGISIGSALSPQWCLRQNPKKVGFHPCRQVKIQFKCRRFRIKRKHQNARLSNGNGGRECPRS